MFEMFEMSLSTSDHVFSYYNKVEFISISATLNIHLVNVKKYITTYITKLPVAVALMPATFLKKDPALVFLYKFCEILKSTFFTEHLRVTSSRSLSS